MSPARSAPRIRGRMHKVWRPRSVTVGRTPVCMHPSRGLGAARALQGCGFLRQWPRSGWRSCATQRFFDSLRGCLHLCWVSGILARTLLCNVTSVTLRKSASRLLVAVVFGVLFAVLGTLTGALLKQTFIGGSHAEVVACEFNTCNDLVCGYTELARKCRILHTGECATGAC